ncbi:MAG TPA: DUF4333 domain-containing protein [Mycobacterium sp.]|nr:DUF4333 domain-containing protein [Mycobacterium sp.]
MHINNSRKKFVTAAFAAIAGAVALTGCQSPFTSAEPDYEALESYVFDEVNGDFPSQISREVSGVDCPRQADTVTSGESFVCTVDVDGHAVRVEVTAKNEGLDFNTLDMVYDLGPAAQDFADQISNEVEFPITLSCGEGLKVVPIGDSFECTAADEYGDTRTIRITANPDGEFWEVLD